MFGTFQLILWFKVPSFREQSTPQSNGWSSCFHMFPYLKSNFFRFSRYTSSDNSIACMCISRSMIPRNTYYIPIWLVGSLPFPHYSPLVFVFPRFSWIFDGGLNPNKSHKKTNVILTLPNSFWVIPLYPYVRAPTKLTPVESHWGFLSH